MTKRNFSDRSKDILLPYIYIKKLSYSPTKGHRLMCWSKARMRRSIGEWC